MTSNNIHFYHLLVRSIDIYILIISLVLQLKQFYHFRSNYTAASESNLKREITYQVSYFVIDSPNLLLMKCILRYISITQLSCMHFHWYCQPSETLQELILVRSSTRIFGKMCTEKDKKNRWGHPTYNAVSFSHSS